MRINKSFYSILVALLALVVVLFTACATQSVVFETTDSHLEGNGYVYGNFDLSVYVEDVLLKTPLETVGIIIENVETEETFSFILKGDNEDSNLISPVTPGNYSVKEVEYLSANDFGVLQTRDRGDFDLEGYKTDFVVEPNTAMYLGDFVAESNRLGSLISWTLDYPTYNFINTTKRIKEKYTQLEENNIIFVSNLKASKTSSGMINLKDIMSPEDYKNFLDRVNTEKFEDTSGESGFL